jgi:protein TonB
MFDKLVESSSTGADLRPRRRIFAASFLFVAALFATAVIASIYAAEFDLGNDNFDLAQLLTPIAETEPAEPELMTQQNERRSENQSNRFERQVLMAATDDPSRVPDKPSVVVNPYASTSPDKWDIATIGTRDSGPGPAEAPTGGGNSSSNRGSQLESASDDTVERQPPPPVKRVAAPNPIKSEGVINGKATHLPKPAYSAAAIAMRAQGAVNVQVTIDEEGKVISAKAVSGNPLLKVEAEKAAWKARFSPTYLSKVPVKVTGVIVYNFTRN